MNGTILEFLKMKPTSTTERGAERARAILLAAQDLVIEEGFAGLSMRAVASRVGISLGNLQHYYASKEQLLSSLVKYMMDTYQFALRETLLALNASTPERRLEDGIKLLLAEVQNPKTAAVFLELWALSSRTQFAAELLAMVRSRELKAMKQLLRELPGVKIDPRQDFRAQTMVLIIEGLLAQVGRNGVRASSRQELAAAAYRSIMRIAFEGA